MTGRTVELDESDVLSRFCVSGGWGKKTTGKHLPTCDSYDLADNGVSDY